MKKFILSFLFFLILNVTRQAQAQVSISANISFGNPYAYSYYNPYYSTGASYGSYIYNSFLNPYYNYSYTSPYRYKTVTPPNLALYNAIQAQGEQKMQAYYEEKLNQDEQNQMPVPDNSNQSPDLQAPKIEVFEKL
ncbi:MAG: hypothetical protein ACD_73C00442G0005 [uncultured bacterium]|nr:MAG: hypothetical protein ACD_73C00442G0005 [uncultured bacterium]